MANISQMTFSNAFSSMKIFKFRKKKKQSLRFVPRGSLQNKSALVQIMAWHRTSDKPFSEPMMDYFDDAYTRLSASINFNVSYVYFIARVYIPKQIR